MTSTTKRTIHAIGAFTGKRIDPTKWEIPSGYERCEITGKLHPESELEITFQHYLFDKAFLIATGIYCEDAAWLSEEGFDFILGTLDTLGVLDAYRAAFDHLQDFINGRCFINATGLVWAEQSAPTCLLCAA